MNDLHSGERPPMVTDGREIVRLLTRVGTVKLQLPQSMRGVLNATDLHVQIRPVPLYDGGTKKTEWIFRAGGSFRSYFEARLVDSNDPGMYTGDDDFKSMFLSLFTPDDWNVYRLNHEVWSRRFARLVWPTYEIATQLSNLHFNNQLSDRTQISRITDSVEHFKRTGEWLGVLNIQCAGCDESLWIWEYYREAECPHCGVPPEVKNPEFSVESDAP